MTLKKGKNGPFRSSSSINNYNKFLAELDSKNQENALNYNYYDLKNSGIRNPEKGSDTAVYKSKYNFSELNKTLIEINEQNNNKKKSNILFIRKDDLEQQPILKEQMLVEQQEKRKVTIVLDFEINNISDLLKLIDLYPDEKDIEYNIDIHCLHKIKKPLIQLNSMIGLKQIKENVVDQILFYIQKLHLNANENGITNDFMHTVIYGPPGTGKTEIAKILGAIFAKMGVLSNGGFKKVTRSDLVAGYLGQTALKTRDVIKESLGGVLFIDEAYSLGNKEKKDSFSKECIDTLCEALSDHKDNLMVIIAGYETELNDCFFASNQGLSSRFTWRFKVDEYSGKDLYDIFVKKVHESGWLIEENDTFINNKWFEKNKDSFKFYGRDIETLLAKTKIAHSRRVFCLAPDSKRIITLADLNKGLDIYLKNESFHNKDKEKEEKERKLFSHLYM